MKKKRKFPTRYIILFVMLLISAYCIMAIVKEVNTTFTLEASVEDAKREKAKLNDQKKYLQQEATNLNNEDYVVRYARGKYMLTKGDGEQVFTLPNDEK